MIAFAQTGVTALDAGQDGFFPELMIAVIGGAVGFVLAQIVDLVRLAVRHYRKPKLKIDKIGDEYNLLSHVSETEIGRLAERIYGFSLINAGRTIATGVRCQLIKVEVSDKVGKEYTTVSNQVYDLSFYRGHNFHTAAKETVLVPSATTDVAFARWREDWSVIRPEVSALLDYHDEICIGSRLYRFTVVAFDDTGQYCLSVADVHI